MFENPRRGRQARNFTTNVSKILGLKSSSEQIFSANCRWVPLISDLSWERLVFSIPLFIPFSKPWSQTASETLRGPKTMSVLRGNTSTQLSFVSSKSVISHNNTAHILLGQNKTKQTKQVKHNISTPSYKKPIFCELCPWDPTFTHFYDTHFQEISVKIINSTEVPKRCAVLCLSNF